MPDQPILIYPITAEPVLVPTAIDQWASQGSGPIFARRRFIPPEGDELPRRPTAPVTLDQWWTPSPQLPDRPRSTLFAGSQRAGGFSVLETFDDIPWKSLEGTPDFRWRRFMVVEGEEQPRLPTAPTETITLDKWDAQDGPIFNRQRFIVPEGEEIPRIPTPPAESITLDKWESQDLPVFNRRRFIGEVPTHSPMAPAPIALDLWASTPAIVYTKPRFIPSTISGSPAPIPQVLSPSMASWDVDPPMVFRRPRFMVGTSPGPVAPAVFIAETIRSDKWESRSGAIFLQRQFMRGPGGHTFFEIPLLPVQPPLEPPRELTLYTEPVHTLVLVVQTTHVLEIATTTKVLVLMSESTRALELATTPVHALTIRMGEPPS